MTTGRYLSFGDWRGFKECSRPSPTQRLGCLSVVGFWPESRANAEMAWDGCVAFTISTDYILCLCIYIYTYIYTWYMSIYICDLYVYDYTNWLQKKLQGKPYCMGSQSTSHGYHPTLAVQRALGDVVVSVGTMAGRREIIQDGIALLTKRLWCTMMMSHKMFPVQKFLVVQSLLFE